MEVFFFFEKCRRILVQPPARPQGNLATSPDSPEMPGYPLGRFTCVPKILPEYLGTERVPMNDGQERLCESDTSNEEHLHKVSFTRL